MISDFCGDLPFTLDDHSSYITKYHKVSQGLVGKVGENQEKLERPSQSPSGRIRVHTPIHAENHCLVGQMPVLLHHQTNSLEGLGLLALLLCPV